MTASAAEGAGDFFAIRMPKLFRRRELRPVPRMDTAKHQERFGPEQQGFTLPVREERALLLPDCDAIERPRRIRSARDSINFLRRLGHEHADGAHAGLGGDGVWKR